MKKSESQSSTIQKAFATQLTGTFAHTALFAANPFGVDDFAPKERKGKDQSKRSGTYTLEPGKSIVLRYRVIFHNGDDKAGKIAERYKEFSQEK